MQAESKQDTGPKDPWAEKIILFQVAGNRWGRPRQRMYRALKELDRDRIDRAINALEAAGVVVSKGQSVHQTAALRRIDALGVLCV